jgi:hypothetical protein
VRRLALAAVVLPLVFAACGSGGGEKTTSSPSTAAAAPADPGRAAVVALIQAAVHDDRKALWNLLSTPSQKRLGPTFADFERGSALVIERALEPFENEPVTPFVSQNVSQEFGVVAIRSGAKALAFPLRSENGAWKVETPGPIQFQILGPQPGSRGPVAQLAVEVHSPGVLGDAVLFVDGKALAPELTPTPGKATAFANLSKALQPGTHIAVVYAQEGRNAGAEAWSFTATKP